MYRPAVAFGMRRSPVHLGITHRTWRFSLLLPELQLSTWTGHQLVQAGQLVPRVSATSSRAAVHSSGRRSWSRPGRRNHAMTRRFWPQNLRAAARLCSGPATAASALCLRQIHRFSGLVYPQRSHDGREWQKHRFSGLVARRPSMKLRAQLWRRGWKTPTSRLLG